MLVPHNKPSLGAEEEAAIVKVLRSGWIAEGPVCFQFESLLKQKMHISNGDFVAVSSGTAALYMALRELRLPANGEVLIPTYSCTALLNAILWAGLVPVPVDVGRSDINIDVESCRQSMTPRTVAVVPVHTYGFPVEISQFRSLNIQIVEDCAQAVGSFVDGVHVGQQGDLAIFSFYASKFIATAYGGAVFSKNGSQVQSFLNYRKYDCPDIYEQKWPVQMSDIHAALGCAQLEKLEDFLEKRKQIVQVYSEVCNKKQIQIVEAHDKNVTPNNFRFVLRFKDEVTQNKFISWMAAKDIRCINPMESKELLHIYLGHQPAMCPRAYELSQTTVSIPVFPSLMDDGRAEYVAKCIGDF